MIVGRDAELSRIDRLVADAKDGRSRSLVVRGEAGIGKTALLDHAARVASGMRVLGVVGIESETEVAFAALQVLFAGDADRIDAIPQTQADCLRVAFGTSGEPVDRGLPGAATLSLLSELAGDGPLLCLLDDVQWFDQPSLDALLFAVRRLQADPIATIFAIRDGERPFHAPGIESLPLDRLEQADAARLASTVRPVRSEMVKRILDESGGNPLAIIELTTNVDAAGWPAPVAPLPATGRLQTHFGRQVRDLGPRTRSALLLAAADHGSDLATLMTAAGQVGIEAADFEPAERRRLVQVAAGGVAFRHPLIRAAAYQEGSFAARLAAHGALAAVLSDPRDADRRAWHRALAASGADESVAAELERVADRAAGRGGPSTAVRALERAAQLSSAPAERGRRLVAAARAAYDAGQGDRAVELAEDGVALTDEPREVAKAGWIRAQVAYERTSPADAARLAVDAATPVLTTEPDQAVAVLTEAMWCARDAADAELVGLCAERLAQVRGGSAVLVDGLVGMSRLLRGDVAGAVDPMRAMVESAGQREDTPTLERLTAGFMALLIGADGRAAAMLGRLVEELRRQGAMGWLPYTLELLGTTQLATGRLREADASLVEAVTLADEFGQQLQVVVLTSMSAWLAAVRGDPATAQRHAARVLSDNRHHGIAAAQAEWALAVVDLTAGNAHSALDRLDGVCGGLPGRDVMVRAVPDHVEAAVRAGDSGRARTYLPQLTEWATHTDRPVARGLMLRCQALLADGADTDGAFRESLDVDGCGPYDRARTRFAYGGWLRRRRRPKAAREQLVRAHHEFEEIGAHGWDRLVRAELVALGDDVPDHSPATDAGQLTPQELQVARRAARGMSNREIAAELFLSPRTVGYHLYKAYPKLGVRRRGELAHLDL
ncbi:AAA family ATPase [Actinopolymorpha sp. B9G3]|uniref:ATP-binding protein n=1 Tax=Actinopolymorpha sp. B9G3 TaxID=3158970 RepID=UPI0032D8B56B